MIFSKPVVFSATDSPGESASLLQAPGSSQKGDRRGLLALGLLWLASRALPLYWVFSQLDRKFDFELPEVKKLLEYGFWERKGAMLDTYFGNGLILHPNNHNYVNHPYPILWVYAGLYRLGGEVLVYASLAAVGLVSCLLVYVILGRYFTRSSAWAGAALFTVSQGTLEFDVNTDTVAFGTVVWLLVMLVVSRVEQERRDFSRRELWLLGLGVFVAGQCTWFALTVLPALMLITLPPGMSLANAIRRPFCIAPWRALIFGGTATLGVFLLQVFFYSSSAQGDQNYVLEQMGLANGMSRWSRLPWIFCRMILSGPALWLGALVALYQCRTLLKSNRLMQGAACYLPTLLAVCLILPGLLSRNQHGFRYPLFPCAILVCFVFERARQRWLHLILAGLAGAGLLLGFAKVQVVNKSSMAAHTLGKWIANNTAAHDVILFNRKELSPPVQPSDVEFGSRVGCSADRNFVLAIFDPAAAQAVVRRFLPEQATFLFLRDTTQPLAGELEQILAHDAKLLARTNLPVTIEPISVYKFARQQLRASLNDQSAAVEQRAANPADANAFSLELYRLDARAINWLRATNQPPR